MKSSHPGLALVFFVSLVSAFSASADWSAKMTTRIGSKDVTEIHGKVSMQGPKVRVDLATPTDMSIIYDQTKKKSFALIHSAKVRLDGGFEPYRDRIPVCLPNAIDSCLAQMGLKKSKSESVDGVPCDLYTGKVSDSDVKLWRPTKMKEVPAVKTVVVPKDGDPVETRFTDIQTRPVDAKLFVVPKNYVRAGEMDQLMKSLKGFSTE